MICDDENNQAVTRDAFDLFHYILQKRMSLGRLCVADSVALRAYARENLRTLSRRFGYFGCLLIFSTAPDVCIERDQRRERQVGESVVRYHSDLLTQALQDIPGEGWELVHMLSAGRDEPEIRFED
jgi:protein phosphatase